MTIEQIRAIMFSGCSLRDSQACDIGEFIRDDCIDIQDKIKGYSLFLSQGRGRYPVTELDILKVILNDESFDPSSSLL